MRKIFFVVSFLVVFLTNCFGQTDTLREIQLRKSFWENPSEKWKLTEIPAKWENESAVILAKQTDYWVKKISIVSVLEERYHSHKRIKVLDNNAVEAYSEFSFGETENRGFNSIFSTNSVNYYYGIKLIKPDGREEIIDESEKVHQEVTHRRNRVGYDKIAIPNLEKGDIIDFYYCVESRFSMNVFYVFDPIRYFVNDTYPIMHQQLSVEIARKCFLNCKSVNGAPELIEDTNDDQEKVFTYHMFDQDREKMDVQLWSYPYAELPCIKFQAFNSGPALSAKPSYTAFWGEYEKIKSDINANGLTFLTQNLHSAGRGTFYPALNRYIKNKYGKKLSVEPEIMVKDAYFFLREFWNRQPYLMEVQNGGYWQFYNVYNLVGAMSRLLKNYDIEHDVLYIMPKYLGKESDLLFLDELSVGLHVEGSKEPIFITDLYTNSLPELIPDYFQGVEAYAVAILESNLLVRKVKLPVTNFKSNTAISSQISFKPEDTKLTINSEFTITGLAKQEWDSIVINNRLIHNEFKMVEYEKFIKDDGERKDVESYRNFQEKLLVKFEDEDKKRVEKLENKLKNLFGLQDSKVTSFELVSSGRWLENKVMKFKINWETAEPIVNTGEISFLSIGKFMNQSVKEEVLEEERNLDVHFSSVNNLSHQITLIVPNEYKVKGLESLNTHFEDDFFQLNCVVESETINPTINLMQLVKLRHIPKSKWESVKSFFHACRSLNKKQVLIQANLQ